MLADTYMKYRLSLLELYGLDVVHCVSLSSYAFDACLKTTDVKLDPPYTPEFYHLTRWSLRGGFVTCVTPYMESSGGMAVVHERISCTWILTHSMQQYCAPTYLREILGRLGDG